jgi:hypothetical protein
MLGRIRSKDQYVSVRPTNATTAGQNASERYAFCAMLETDSSSEGFGAVAVVSMFLHFSLEWALQGSICTKCAIPVCHSSRSPLRRKRAPSTLVNFSAHRTYDECRHA